MKLDMSFITGTGVQTPSEPREAPSADKGGGAPADPSRYLFPAEAPAVSAANMSTTEKDAYITRTQRTRAFEQAVAAGCKAQILLDIEQKQDPYRMLLCAAEAIGQLSGNGDSYFLEVQQKLREVYGTDEPQRCV